MPIFNPTLICQQAATTAPGPPDPAQVYKNTRPSDWLTMPEPADNEIYLLFHIPEGVSSLLAFTVTCTGDYTVELGTVSNGAFSASGSTSAASGSVYEAELFADDYGDLTSDGMKQVMVKITGTDILTWAPSTHSKKTGPSNFAGWNIVEISCRLPKGTSVACGYSTNNKTLKKLKYFSWYGANAAENMDFMFYFCYSLIAIPELDTSGVTSMGSMFRYCYSLTAIPELDTSSVTNMSCMFQNCYSLTAIPELDTSLVTDMNYTFYYCCSLTAIPELDTSSVTNMNYMFQNCYSLTAIPELDTSLVTDMSSMFGYCYSLASILLDPSVSGWAGCALGFSSCSLGHAAIVALFNSLPTITASKAITLTGNPGVSELTEDEQAIATNKNWTLTL